MLKVFQTDRRIDGRADRLTDVTFKLLHFSNINNNSWDGLREGSSTKNTTATTSRMWCLGKHAYFLYKEIHSNLFYF